MIHIFSYNYILIGNKIKNTDAELSSFSISPFPSAGFDASESSKPVCKWIYFYRCNWTSNFLGILKKQVEEKFYIAKHFLRDGMELNVY